MQKLSKNSLGFAALEMILLVILVAVLAFGGWYVYRARHQKVSSAPAITTLASTTKAATTSTPANPYTGWKSYTSSFGVKFFYPSDWTVSTSNQSGSNVVTVSSPTSGSSADNQEVFMNYSANDGGTGSNTNTYTTIPTNASVLTDNFSVNGSTLCLIQYNDRNNSSNVVSVSLQSCHNTSSPVTATGALALPNNGGLDVEILSTSGGDNGSSTTPISLTSSNYSNAKLILGSIKY